MLVVVENEKKSMLTLSLFFSSLLFLFFSKPNFAIGCASSTPAAVEAVEASSSVRRSSSRRCRSDAREASRCDAKGRKKKEISILFRRERCQRKKKKKNSYLSLSLSTPSRQQKQRGPCCRRRRGPFASHGTGQQQRRLVVVAGSTDGGREEEQKGDQRRQ